MAVRIREGATDASTGASLNSTDHQRASGSNLPHDEGPRRSEAPRERWLLAQLGFIKNDETLGLLVARRRAGIGTFFECVPAVQSAPLTERLNRGFAEHPCDGA